MTASCQFFFTNAHVEGLRAFVEQAATAIQNTRLYETIRRQKTYLERLRRISQRIAPERDLYRFMQAVVDSLADEFGYSVVRLLMGDDQKQELTLKALSGDISSLLNIEKHIHTQSYQSGIFGWVMRNNQPYLSLNVHKDELYLPDPVDIQIRSELAVPIRQRGMVVGVLSVSALEKNPLDKIDLEALSEFSSDLAVSLENVSLNEQVRQHAFDLELMVNQLEEASRLKDEFLSLSSHELRTPLNAIIGHTGILLLGQPKDGKEHFRLRRIRENSNRLLGLINDILDLSRMEAGQLQFSKEKISLSALIKKIGKEAQILAEAKGLELKIEISEEIPLIVELDIRAFTKILTNLILNAIKFTEIGEVKIKAHMKDELFEIVISDTGIGIPEDMQSAVFERFRQVDGSYSRAFGGAGLGLSIVEQLCTMMNGTINLESIEGQGSAFTVRLPL